MSAFVRSALTCVGSVTTDLRRLAVIALLAIAGCGAPAGGSGPPASPTVSCNGVPVDRCQEAVDAVARSLPNTAALKIDVTCVSGTCTPESGAMDTVVTLVDGGTLRSSTIPWGSGFGTSGGKPVPAPPIAVPDLPVAPECLGVPLATCQQMAQSSIGVAGGPAIVGILVRCTAAVCTDKQGEGDTVITLADGTTSTSGWGYASAE
jgi:hypothetical protein